MRRRRLPDDRAPAERAEQCRERAAALRADHEQRTTEANTRAAALRQQADAIEADVRAAGEGVDHEADRLTRAASAYAQAAAVEQRLPELRDVAGVLGAQVDQARSEAEELALRVEGLQREVDDALGEERGDVVPAQAVTARSRRLAAEGLLAEAADALAQAEQALADAERRHELAEAEVDRAELELASLVQLAEDVLSGAEDARVARQAEEDERQRRQAEEHRQGQAAAVMLDLPGRLVLARSRARPLEEAGWRNLHPSGRSRP